MSLFIHSKSEMKLESTHLSDNLLLKCQFPHANGSNAKYKYEIYLFFITAALHPARAELNSTVGPAVVPVSTIGLDEVTNSATGVPVRTTSSVESNSDFGHRDHLGRRSTHFSDRQDKNGTWAQGPDYGPAIFTMVISIIGSNSLMSIC